MGVQFDEVNFVLKFDLIINVLLHFMVKLLVVLLYTTLAVERYRAEYFGQGEIVPFAFGG